MLNRIANVLPTWIFVFLWLAANAAVFCNTLWKYTTKDEYFYLRRTVGMAVPVARASASALNLNLALILLPVCRNLLSLVRGSCQCCTRTTALCRLLDQAISFHKLCAYAICFWTGVHYFSHTFNFRGLVAAAGRDDSELLGKLSRLSGSDNDTWFNPIRTNDTNAIYEVVKSLPGSTGIVATIVLVIMVASSTETIRRSFFELFWFTHQIFIIFFAVLIAHDCGGLGRALINAKEHKVGYCGDRHDEWGVELNGTIACPSPQFASKDGETWMWVIGPLTIYLIERVVRFTRRFQTTEIVKVVKHPSKVLELQMRRFAFKMNAGQYVFINCAQASHLEWHPFTLTSAPEEDFFSVHIRVVGDWTQKVAAACEAANGCMDAMPKFSVDGPFGTCSDDVFKYEVALLIGAGIGVTPFASILKHIWYMHSSGKQPHLKKVYFIWTCPETHSFSWFADLLKDLEDKVSKSDNPDFLNIQIYWTRGWTKSQMNVIVDTVDRSVDTVTGLKHRTKFGRPVWPVVFSSIRNLHDRAKVGVFFCGPAAMSSDIETASNAHSSNNPLKTRFVYNKENF